MKMKKNIAKLLTFSLIASGTDISKINLGNPSVNGKGNLIYEPKKLNDPDFIDFLTENTTKNSGLSNEVYNFSTYSIYQTNEKTKNNELSVKDYLTQKLTAIQAFKDSIENKN